MSADQETVTADQPTRFPHTRSEALRSWEEFRPRIGAYADARNGVRPGHRAVSRLSPAIRRRLVTEYELVASTLEAYPFARAEKFVQEMMWRRYWKSWLELRPGVWRDYQADVVRLRGGLRGYQARRVQEVAAGRSGVAIMDYFARELRETGYLHNHARMWFAGFWVHTEKLPWQLGADFFYRHLLDADPAANTLSWRWVAGLQTQGKTYLTRRSNLERYVESSLLAAHGGGLDQLDDKLAQPARVEDTSLLHAELPPDADDTALPAGLPVQAGLWVHADDLCTEAAQPLARFRPQAVFAGLDTGVLEAEAVSVLRRGHLQASVRDGLARAGQHFGAPAHYEDAPLPEALAAWARGQGLRAVVALRPSVGPLWDLLPALRARLAEDAVALHLVWRPEDSQFLPFARSGYFSFWQGVRDDLGGGAQSTGEADEPVARRRGPGRRQG